jgi:hypothetical protein
MTMLDRRQLLLAAATLAGAALPRTIALAADATANQPLLDLLAMVPKGVADPPSDAGQIAVFANPAAQLKALGVAVPTDIKDKTQLQPWIDATRGMAGPSAMAFALAADWRPTFGFSLLDVDESLEYGAPPLVLTIYRGRFNRSEIDAALTASGYKTLDEAGTRVWSLSEDESIDPKNAANRLVLARMNNVALPDDGTLLAAPRLDALRAMLGAVSGGATPVATNDALQSLATAIPAELVTALILNNEGIGPSSPAKLAVTGLTAGAVMSSEGPASSGHAAARLAKWEWALLTGSSSEAAAFAKSIDAGIKTGTSSASRQPYTDFFKSWTAEPVANSPIVRLEIEFPSGVMAQRWQQMVYRRDLGFLSGS